MNIDSRIEQARQQLRTVRTEREESNACHAAMRAAYMRSTLMNLSKIHKLLKRGCDASSYTRAIQDAANRCGDRTAFIPQQYLQKQARMLQSLHKAEMYNHQIKVIEAHSNKIVNYMMCEASVIEREQKELEHDLMIRVGEYLNDKLTLEMAYHTELQDLKAKIRDLRELSKPQDTHVRKYSDTSFDTTDTFNESGSITYAQNDYPLINPVSSFTRMLAFY